MTIRILCVLLLFANVVRAQDMPLSQVLLPDETWKEVKGDWEFITDITSDQKGNLYVSDLHKKTIYRIRPGERPKVFAKLDEKPFNMTVGPKGTLFVCQAEKSRILRFDGDDGKPTGFAERVYAFGMAVSPAGRVYCGTSHTKTITRIDADGKKTEHLPRDLGSVSGLVFWPKGGTLVVARTNKPYLLAFRVEKDGSLTHRERYYSLRSPLNRTIDAEGLTIDRTGRVYACTELGVQVFDTTGRMSGILAKPIRASVTSAAFAGRDSELLYIVCGSGLFVRKMKSRGIRYLCSTPWTP